MFRFDAIVSVTSIRFGGVGLLDAETYAFLEVRLAVEHSGE